jgi:hypothetical protein
MQFLRNNPAYRNFLAGDEAEIDALRKLGNRIKTLRLAVISECVFNEY